MLLGPISHFDSECFVNGYLHTSVDVFDVVVRSVRRMVLFASIDAVPDGSLCTPDAENKRSRDPETTLPV